MNDDRLQVIHRWPSPDAREWLKVFLERVAVDQNVRAVVAVGSAVRAGVTSDDLDLIVVCGRRESFDYAVPIELDVRAFELNDVDRDLKDGHPLLGWAVLFGEPIFDRDGTWERVTSSWRDRVPLPDPVQARERAEKVLKYLRSVEEIGDEVAAAELEVSYLTFLARATLADHQVYPASRPELPEQLRTIGDDSLADRLDNALANRETVMRGSQAPRERKQAGS